MPTDWTKLFERFKGQWVALADDEATVIASAKTAKAALADSVAKGTPRPLLYRVPDSLETFRGV